MIAGIFLDCAINQELSIAGNGHGGTVMVDDQLAGRIATQHLLQAGHRAIGFLAGPATSQSGLQRAEGYRTALQEAGIPFQPRWVHHCPPSVDGGREVACQVLVAQPELTALYCYNDLVAVGALQACAELGRQVPNDVAVMGCDDTMLAALVTPPLSTCRVPRLELGTEAMQLLLNQINGCQEECGELMLQPVLIIRASAP